MKSRLKRLHRAALGCLGVVLFAAPSVALEPPIARSELKSGADFVSAEVRALQDDDFANPGMLWVTRGERLWREPAGTSGKSCVGCHSDAASSMKGVATRYPRIDPAAARLMNLEGRINQCRSSNQGAQPLAYESEELLALTAYLTYQSRGMPMNVVVDAQNGREFERARSLFHRRIGQMNLACAQCHDRNWGRTLYSEKLSQGHGTAFPAYRLEWQTLGSLQRRIRSCYSGLRAEMPPYGARELVELELYLGWRSNGLAIEAPGVRR